MPLDTPHRLVPAASARVATQRRSANRRDEARCRWILHTVTVIARAHRDRDTRVIIVRLLPGFARELGRAIRVRNDRRPHCCRAIDAGREIRERSRFRLYEKDLALRADGARHVEVERDFLGPVGVAARIGGATILIDLSEATVRRRAGRQAELRTIDRKVALSASVIVGIDDRNRLAGAIRGGGGGEIVRRPQIRRSIPARTAGREWSALFVDTDQGVTACGFGCGGRGDPRMRATLRQAAIQAGGGAGDRALLDWHVAGSECGESRDAQEGPCGMLHFASPVQLDAPSPKSPSVVGGCRSVAAIRTTRRESRGTKRTYAQETNVRKGP